MINGNIWRTETVNSAVCSSCQTLSSWFARVIKNTLDDGDVPDVESPLEAVFWIYWQVVSIVEAYNLGKVLQLIPQHTVVACGQRYRLDFAVSGTKIGVELDGHDFHERTKEQVAYRNQRDRHLLAEGWTIVHCSGSELYRRQGLVVQEIWKLAISAEAVADKKETAPCV